MNEEQEDWDFDFDEIYQDEVQEEDTESEGVSTKQRAPITGLRSRYSSGEAWQQEKWIPLEVDITKQAVKVGYNSQDVKELWKLFNLLTEAWDNIDYIFGYVVVDDMQKIKVKCRELLVKHSTGQIPMIVHNNLQYFKKAIYTISGRKNFRYEVEREGKGLYSQARRKITQ